MSRLLALCVCLTCVCTWTPLRAAPESGSIPDSLRAWSGWVMKGLEYRACPFVANHTPNARGDFVCAWPQALQLDAAPDHATFSIRWRVDAPSWIALPGNSQYWPQQVIVNGRPAPVLSHAQPGQPALPSLRLGSGDYRIQGRIPWQDRPQALPVPAAIGLVALRVDGKAISPVQRDRSSVTLGRGSAVKAQADSLQVRVYRKLSDGIPAMLTTRMDVNVSGQAREETLGPVLPAGFVPTALVGDWPARLDDDGRLHMQVRPGNETLTLTARATQPLTGITAKPASAPWPKQEIWSYQADPRLRVTSVNGKTQVDPNQAGVPEAWRRLPAFAMDDGATLKIDERSRGQSADQGNRLNLQREAWLDFSGHGWYAQDLIRGRMVRGWRFDVASPYQLQRASVGTTGAGGEPLLVTRGGAKGLRGFEWRTPAVDLGAGLRIDAGSSQLPVTGWQQSFDGVQQTLHLPFGYKLLAATGVDRVRGSWMSRWSLLDVFVCAILVLLAGRAFGWIGTGITLVYVLLGYQEAGSPLWSLIAVIALALIANALPDGRLRTIAELLKRVALIVLILMALPFVAVQLREALYPQLEHGGWQRLVMDQLAHKPTPRLQRAGRSSKPAPAPEFRQRAAKLSKSLGRNAMETANPVTITVSGSRITQAQLIDHYAESTVIQTGMGMPDWNMGSRATLSWSGPVLASQDVHLLIAPPWLVRPLRVLLVALLAWLVWRLFAGSLPSRRRMAGAAGAALMLLVPAMLPHAVQAQGFPPDALLKQLRQRLSEAPKCAPACANAAQAQIAASGDSVHVALQINAAQSVALPLPVADGATPLQAVKVDGSIQDNVARTNEGTLWIAVDRGVHRVDLDYTASADKASLRFILRPAQAQFHGNGWSASGLSDDRLLSDTLNLSRARSGEGGKATAGVQQFPPYVRVQRDVSLGLDWTVHTRVRRISPASGGFTVQVPVLSGEHVQSSGFKVVDGKVTAAIDDGRSGANWSGTLDKHASLTLTAPSLGDRAEVWHVLVSPTWHVQFKGVPVTSPPANANENDYRNFEFQPLPGEMLTVDITRPEAVAGATRAIDSVTLDSDAGRHASTYGMNFTVRASRGGEQAIALPKNAEVLAVSRDGQSLNLRPGDGRLTLPIVPGTHRFSVRFRQPDGIAMIERTPKVALGLVSANVNLNLSLPADRWLLATWGPTVGPAVLYWGELVVMILVAFALARSGRARLKFRHWLLLGLGFSTFSWVALLVVVAWLFAFDWRARSEPLANESHFNLAQIGLGLLTLIALACLISAIPQGLLGQPDMHVTGNGSSAHALRWFVDRSSDELPHAYAFSLPLWVYKLLMLAWALWLANALIGWLRDAFQAWTKGGYWRQAGKAVAQPAGAIESASMPQDPESK